MTSTKKMLLGTGAAMFAVTAGVNTGAQAADVMLRKGPPINFVRICDEFGPGFWNIPGTTFCMSTRGQIQVDHDYFPTKELMYLTQDTKKNGAYTANLVAPNQQDTLGVQTQGVPALDIRTMTSWGPMRTFAQIKLTLNVGNFNSQTGPGGETATKPQCYKCYMQWAGWTIGTEPADPFGYGSFHQDDLTNTVMGEKGEKWGVNYTWTPKGPGQPPLKGFKPLPDGWSVMVGAEDPFAHVAKGIFGNAYESLVLAPGSPVGRGFVAPAAGPLNFPDFVVAIHDEEDPPGKDDIPLGSNTRDYNPNFGIASIHAALALHNDTAIAANGDQGLMPVANCAPSTISCANLGPPSQNWGWAADAGMRFWVPMAPNARKAALRQYDYVWIMADYADGALEYSGIPDQGNLSVGDTYTLGGFSRDDMDAKWINNGAGGFYADKEKLFTITGQYHHILTDCTDPVNCFRMNLYVTYTAITPGSITQNVDWTAGGLGKAHKMQLTGNIVWGANQDAGITKTYTHVTSPEVQFEVQYSKLWQDMPCNNNGDATIACITPTALPAGITKDPSNVVYRFTVAKNW